MASKMAIVVGHKASSPGASIAAPLNCSEYEYNKDLALYVYRDARNSSLDAQIFTRDGTSIKGVYKKVKEWFGEDEGVCAVELHCNSAVSDEAYGTEILIDAVPSESQALAECMETEIYPIFGRQDKGKRGVKLLHDGDRGHYALEQTDKPSVILEPAFGNNPKEAALLAKNKMAYSKAIVNAVLLFYNSKLN